MNYHYHSKEKPIQAPYLDSQMQQSLVFIVILDLGAKIIQITPRFSQGVDLIHRVYKYFAISSHKSDRLKFIYIYIYIYIYI
jgi:hypothetical protein